MLTLLVVFVDGRELNLAPETVAEANRLAAFYAAKKEVEYVGLAAY